MAIARAGFELTAKDKTKAAFSRVDRSLRGIKNQASSVINTFAGLAAAAGVGLGLKNAVQSFANFEDAMADLSAITGATGEDLKFLSDQAKTLGSTTKRSASEAATAFKLMASAKPELLENAQALTKTTKAAMTLSDAAGIPLANATKTLGSALNQFGKGADQANRFINTLAAGAQKGASEIADVSMALKESGVVAKQLGLNFEETNAAIQILGANAIKGSQAGTQLKNVLLGLATKGSSDINPEIVGLGQALDNLAQKNLSTAEKTKLFGRESIVAGNILLEQRDKVEQLTSALTGTNTAYEQASIRNNTLSARYEILKNRLNVAAIELGQHLKPALDIVIDATDGFIGSADDARRTIKKLSAAVLVFASKATQMAQIVVQAVGIIANGFRMLGDVISNTIDSTVGFLEDLGGLIPNATNPMEEHINRMMQKHPELRQQLEKSKQSSKGYFESITNWSLQANQQLTEFQKNAEGAALSTLKEAHATKQAADNKKVHTTETQKQAQALQQLMQQKTEQTTKESNLNQIMKEGEQLRKSVMTSEERYAEQLQRINFLLEKRAISEQTAARAKSQAKQTFLQSQGIADKLQQENSLVQSQADSIANIFQQSIFSSWEQGVDGMVQSFVQGIARILAEAASAQIGQALQGSLGGGGGGMGGIFGSIFGGGGGGGLGGGMGGIFSSIIGGLFAEGGQIRSNRLNVVGEQGPELFVPRTSGTIIPNDKIGGGGTMISMNINTPDANSFKRAEGNIGAQIAMQLDRAQRRNT